MLGQVDEKDRERPAEGPLPHDGAPPPADVAIIGVSVLLPGASDLGHYWENILDKTGAITEIPADRWPADVYFDADRAAEDKIASKWGGFLDDITFDPTRYGIPPTAVPSIDPAQLLALAGAEAALRDAGLTEMPAELRRRAAVILGFTGGLGELGLQYAARAELARALPAVPAATLDFLPRWTSDSFAGLLPNVIAGRIANRFDLGGTSFVVDAACATSFAALRQAVVELETRRSDVVLCGAVEAGQGPFAFTCFSKAHALSASGRCRAFDAAADGTAIAEGVVMLVLRRLADARHAGDRVYAVIKGIDGSSDGRGRSMMAPLPDGQKRAARRAYEQAGYAASTVELFEAHGTGTVSGDAAEIESLSTLLREDGAPPRSCAVGSVKTLIGHAEGAAGLAGLVKAALSLHHKILPPHAGVETPNAALADPSCPIALHGAARPWLPPLGSARRAGVSAFGFGGANFHVTLEEADPQGAAHAHRASGRSRWPAELFVWCAPDRAALTSLAGQSLTALKGAETPALGGIAKALAADLGKGPARLAIVAETPAQLTERLSQAIQRLSEGSSQRPLPRGVYFADKPLAADGRVALLFPGQGSQHPDMGRELAVLFAEVREALAGADEVLAETPTYCGRSDRRLSRLIYPFDRFSEAEEAAARQALAATDVAQPALGAVETGALALLRRLGIDPAAVAGHSYGEYVALYAGGVLHRDDLLRISEARGRFIVGAVRGADLGTMAAVTGTASAVRAALTGRDVVIANVNAPDQTVISGSRAGVADAIAHLAAAGFAATPIPVSAAFHSPLIAPAQEPLAGFFNTVSWSAPQIPVYANTTGAAHPDHPVSIRQAMARHLAAPVDFVGMIEAMYRDGQRVFLEVGPKSVLTNLTRRILGERPHVAVATDGAGGGLVGLLHALAAIFVQGARIDLVRLFDGRDLPRIDPKSFAEAEPAAPKPRSGLWIVNGSRARPVGAPVRTFVAAMPVADTAQPARAASRSTHDETRRARKEIAMNVFQGPVDLGGSDEPDASGVARALADHHRTMQQFLQMQERLMLAYLSGGQPGAAQPARPFSTPRPSPRRMGAPVAPSQPAVTTPAPQAAAIAPPPPSPPAPPTAPAVAPAPVVAAAVQDPKTLLLEIASDKTGYPKDMLDPALNMEADLGIDSIKRVEILAAFRKAHPPALAEYLSPRMTQIAKAQTLQAVLDNIAAALAEDGAPRPFESAGSEPAAALTRYVMRPVAEDLPVDPQASVPAGLYLLVADGQGLAAALERRLAQNGAIVRSVPDGVLGDDVALASWLASVRSAGPIRGLVALAGTERPGAWPIGMERAVKSLFPLLRLAAPDLADGGRVLLASAMGGLFARDALALADRASIFAGAGGGVGLAKTLAVEWPDAICKAVDLDPEVACDAQAAQLHAELATPGGRCEVGYPAGRRTIFQTVEAPLDSSRLLAPSLPDANWVVLAIGGARGITAETLRPFAAAGATCVIIGRSQLPGDEAAALAALPDAKSLRAHFLAEGAATGERPTPARIEAKIAAALREREIRANMADFVRLGARLDYRVCDMRAAEDVRRLMAQIYADYSRLDAVLYGAGLIEDKLVVDKTRESLARVFDTKVDGAHHLLSGLQPDSLKFLALFSSVAGRYGNRGQADYAAANEVLNRLAWQAQARFGDGIKVVSMNWGAWASTTNGPGMLTPETARQFRARGLRLIEPPEGRDALWREYLYGPRDQVEVIGGEHPWEAQEAAAAALRERPDRRKVA